MRGSVCGNHYRQLLTEWHLASWRNYHHRGSNRACSFKHPGNTLNHSSISICSARLTKKHHLTRHEWLWSKKSHIAMRNLRNMKTFAGKKPPCVTREDEFHTTRDDTTRYFLQHRTVLPVGTREWNVFSTGIVLSLHFTMSLETLCTDYRRKCETIRCRLLRVFDLLWASS